MSTLLWWLIPLAAVIIGVAVSSIVNYYRRDREDHDLGQRASMREAMNKPHGQRGPRSPQR
ncbi:MAG: hypothetical protein OSA11_07875 [Candidatus Nanopelagicales bacterium]|nr:hypothetical protein [Candidatus Nanopelagicales bacterium]